MDATTLDNLPHGAFSPDAPPDFDARQAALDPTRSFAVAAPAGSGKTGLLTQRVLTLLARCDAPEEVLAITFTRKAAGEMQDRIMAALREAAEQPEPENPHARRTWRLAQAVLQRDEECQWQLLMSPQRLRIQTIDSLCRAITRQLPLDSQLGAQPDTLDAPELAYRQAVHQFLARLETDDTVREDLKRLLRHLDTNLPAIETLLMRLLAKRDQWLGVMLEAQQAHARPYLEAVLRDVIEEQLSRVTDGIGYHASELCHLADQAATNVEQDNPESPILRLKGITALPDPGPAAVADWQALAELMLTARGEWRKRLTKKEGFPAGKPGAALKEQYGEWVAQIQEDTPDLAEQLHAVRQLPPAEYTESQWQLLDSLTRLLPLLSAELTLVFKQLGATDYSAIAQAASFALGDEENPSDIALKLDYRIQHILVDEFQDTAAPQLRLLEQLTAGWQPDDGRTLFIVGDGMQSCYGFRDANVGLFLDAREHGIGEVPMTALDLTVNFRSQTNVVRWVNDIFSRAFPARDDIGRGAVRYSPSIAFNAPLEGEAVQFYGCLHQNDSEEADSETSHPEASPDKTLAQLQEAESVAELAERALAADDEDSVAILVRSRPHLQWILPALARRGLHWQATEIDRLASRMAIVDLMSLTRALLNLDDRIAWLSILRAPWCGLDLHDLHALVTTDLGVQNPWPRYGWPVIWRQLQLRDQVPGITDTGRQCLDRLMAVLEPAWRERHRKPLRQWIEGIWLALGGPALLAEPGDAQDIPSYFNLLEKHQHGGGLRDWNTFERGVESLFAAPRADANPRLQVMTLHKSKGLEFDTVIIPGLDRASSSDDKELLLWQQRINQAGERQLLLGPLAPTGTDTDPLYQFMRNEAKLRDGFEATRLLYVGCTRAVKRLHLVACVGLDARSGKPRAPRQGSLLRTIWEPVQPQMLSAPTGTQVPAVTSGGDSDYEGLQHILRLAPDWRAPAPTEVTVLQAYRGREFGDEENIPEVEAPAARLARHTGTVLHNQLQRLTEQPLDAWSEAWAEQQRPFWTLQLRQFGWEPETIAEALEKIRWGLHQTLTDPDGRWLLDPTHEDSACERAIHHVVGTEVRESVIDRTFVDGGVRWIVDYKSSQPETDQSPEAFVAQEVATYTPQLARYARVMQDLGETRPIKTALYFPLLASEKRLVEVNP
ncbi:UvrD-helicase domain-containing protein [Marinimicrobium sp. C6131]|uniref:UvrD-helicase domain-containing protein n=1 Tax=Marinimicrobium sp. C6131 TaxID=3022676 RepID=UPI00223D7C8F|nr:UvrD-helicase domain-containing protein [Marinimicrobium sp. C6131]UZJ45285.1 UvrD-helicase domain-containing protein [Marinimicrobium sp. C6131]